MPPPLWRGYLAETAEPADPINARYGEIALTLRLSPLGEWRRKQPLAPASIREILVTGGSLPQRLREAFAFALFEPNGPWDRDDEVLAGWTAAVRAVLHQRGQGRDSRSARLQRNLSNLLTDIGLLGIARRLTEASLAQQQASDDPERFKTLGRLGEIQVRLGDYAAARASYQESWRRQPPDQREGRTAVYLGHLALLEGQLTEAESWYQTAEQADCAQQITFNPYRAMGCIALAWRRADRAEVRRLWDQYRDELDALDDQKALPAAVAALTITLAAADPAWVDRSVERLLTAHYLVEALYPLARGAATPALVEPWLRRIATALQGWQQALNAAVGDIPELDPDENGSPGQVAARIEQALAENDWAPLATDLARAFPMNLLENSHCATGSA